MRIVKLRDISDLKTGPFGTQFSASEYVSNGIPVINVKNIGYGSISAAGLDYVGENTLERLSEHKLKAGDIVFGRKGSVDRHCLICREQEGWMQGSDCIRVRFIDDSVYPEFVSYFLLTNAVKIKINNSAVGSTMASLNTGILGDIDITLPEYTEQKRIALILGEIDKKISKNNMVNDRISSFDAFLECKDLSINDLLEKLLHSNTIIQYEAAKRLQFFQYKEIIDIIRNILLTSRYSKHREIANFILGQMQEKLSTTELKEIFSILIHSIQNDKSIKVKSSAISSLGHLFRKYNLGEEEFRTVENNISSIWNMNRYSIIISIAFSSAYFPKRNYIKEYLIKNLNSKHHKIISWILYGLKEKHYKSESIENLLIHKLSQFGEKSYIYNEIIAFLISINSKKVIPYVKKTLFTQSKIDDEIYTELKNNLSDEFAGLRKNLLEKFK